MILLITTICLQADAVSVQCKTAVWQMYPTPIACLSMLPPVQAFIAEQTVGLPVVAVLAACKSGLLA